MIADIRYVPSGDVTAAAEDAALAIGDFDHEFGSDIAPRPQLPARRRRVRLR